MTKHTHYTTATDGSLHLARCNGCGERHYFRSTYLAKQWMNRHGQMVARTFCTCHPSALPQAVRS